MQYTAMLRLLALLSCLVLSCSALQFGVVTPARLSEAVLQAAVNQTEHRQCTQDFSRWMAALTSKERWAVEMADSWSKSMTGLFHGNAIDFGDSDECIYATSESGQQTASSAPAVRGAHVMPTVMIASRPESAALSSTAQFLRQVVPLTFRASVCVPDSCNVDLVITALNSVATDLLIEEGLEDDLSVTVITFIHAKKLSLSTLPKPGAPHWIFLSALAFLALLAVVATVLDRQLDASESKEARRRWRYLLHFSLSSNMRSLLAPAPPNSMSCLSGIRVLSCLWIMQGHTVEYFPNIINSLDKQKFDGALLTRMLNSYVLSVDTFIIIGGLVCSISFLRAVNKNNSFNWIKYIIRRYARTTPALAVVALYGATWFNISTTGPDVYRGSAKIIVQWYRDYWWSVLLHVSNYLGDALRITPHLWYLSMDMQLYVLAPIILIPLWKRPRIGKALLAVAIVVACLVLGSLSVVEQVKHFNGSDGSSAEELISAISTFYFGTQAHIAPYLIGIGSGYFLYQLKYGGLKLQLNKFHAAGIWLVSAATALAVILAPQSIEKDGLRHPYNAVESFFYIGFSRAAWAVAIALVIIACETGWGGPVNKILSWGGFAPLGKLSFAVYLVHYYFVLTDALFIVHVPQYFSAYVWIRQLLGSTVLALPLSALLYLLVEQPFVLLENELWK